MSKQTLVNQHQKEVFSDELTEFSSPELIVQRLWPDRHRYGSLTFV